MTSSNRPSPTRPTQFSTSSTHTWAKCRFAAPKLARHHGSIRAADGSICVTTASLDQALRATRAFWSERPSPYHPDWSYLLAEYSQGTSSLPSCPPPSYQQFYHSTINSPDSAPGADGIPYSAWRVCPAATASGLQQHFHDIIYRKASPPLQSLVFIPKADQADYADNYRPLGLPNTSDRILDRTTYCPFCSALMGTLHPAQALLNLFREPQFNYLEVQRFLDDTSSLHILLSDLAKAFERVNPHWIMHGLIALKVLYWVLCYCRHILFGRRVLHKIKSTFRPPLAIHTGVDMGRTFSVLWYYHVHKIPRILADKGDMDDNATGGVGMGWLAPAERLITSFASAGFLVLMHSCYRTEILSSENCSLPIISSCPHVVAGYPSLLSSLPSPLPDAWLRLQSGSKVVTIRSSQLSISPSGVRCPSSPHLLSFLHTAPCTCKCKTFLLSSVLVRVVFGGSFL